MIQHSVWFVITVYHKLLKSAVKETYFTHLCHHQILKTFSHLSSLPPVDSDGFPTSLSWQVLGKCFSSPLAIAMGKLLYRLELCFSPRQIGPWSSHTWSTASHSFYHVQWSERVIPYQVTCLLEHCDVSKKKA